MALFYSDLYLYVETLKLLPGGSYAPSGSGLISPSKKGISIGPKFIDSFRINQVDENEDPILGTGTADDPSVGTDNHPLDGKYVTRSIDRANTQDVIIITDIMIDEILNPKSKLAKMLAKHFAGEELTPESKKVPSSH